LADAGGQVHGEAGVPEEVDGRRVWYSAGAFFALATALGAGTVALVVRGALPPELALASALSASAAGVIMTAVEEGRAGGGRGRQLPGDCRLEIN
jgi:hypothetical protein